MTDHISIVVAGDYMPTEHVESAVHRLARPGEMLGPAVPLFLRADLAVVNLEYPLTRATTKQIKSGSHQKGDPCTISVLKQAGIGLVTLANNHVLDYGEQGLADTLDVCSREGIATVGAGLTLEEANKPFCTEIQGLRIAVLGIAENEFSVANERHGGACPLDLVANYNAIKKAKQSADVVVALIHGGREFTHYPGPRMQSICRFFADVGASAVVCHHPHYVQGYEIYKGIPILYSLGTLMYTRMTDPSILEVPVARLNFSNRTLEASVHFDFFRVSLEETKLVDMAADELLAMQERFREYSEALASPDRIESEWDKCCMRHKTFYLFCGLSIPYFIFRVGRRLGIGRFVSVYARWKRNELLNLENMIRCESHREALLYLLEKDREG